MNPVMVLDFVVGLITGILSGFGIGGGTLLMLYLTGVSGTEQFTAGGINLLYFIFCAPPALASHIKNKLVIPRVVIVCIIAGTLTSIGAALAAGWMDTNVLRRMFGGLLLYVGIRELFAKKEK